MTEQMAIEELKALRKDDKRVYAEEYEALEVAIQALEERAQYKAIGTVEDIKKVISFLSNDEDNTIIDDMNLLNQYKFLGTVEELQALKEKAIPKKGIPYNSAKNHKFVECPSCHKDMDLYYHYCQYCGQSVDWTK